MIDPNKEYRVTKIKVKDEKARRFIHEGDTFIGSIDVTRPKLGLIMHGDYGIQTSPIVKIEDLNNGNFLVETKNSVYSVEEVK